jgi:hypothetical protein
VEAIDRQVCLAVTTTAMVGWKRSETAKNVARPAGALRAVLLYALSYRWRGRLWMSVITSWKPGMLWAAVASWAPEQAHSVLCADFVHLYTEFLF